MEPRRERRRQGRVRRLNHLSLVALASLVLACGAEPASTPMTIALLTASQPATICDDALLSGRLVRDAETGLAVAGPTGEITRILWPFGFSARYEADRISLLNEAGGTVAAEGDSVEMGGGFGNRFWTACAGSIRRSATN